MINLAISILWLLIGIIILLGVIWLALYCVKLFVPVPDIIEKMIWAVVLILCLIGVLSLLAGGGGSLHPPFHLSGIAGAGVAARSLTAAVYL